MTRHGFSAAELDLAADVAALHGLTLDEWLTLSASTADAGSYQRRMQLRERTTHERSAPDRPRRPKHPMPDSSASAQARTKGPEAMKKKHRKQIRKMAELGGIMSPEERASFDAALERRTSGPPKPRLRDPEYLRGFARGSVRGAELDASADPLLIRMYGPVMASDLEASRARGAAGVERVDVDGMIVSRVKPW